VISIAQQRLGKIFLVLLEGTLQLIIFPVLVYFPHLLFKKKKKQIPPSKTHFYNLVENIFNDEYYSNITPFSKNYEITSIIHYAGSSNNFQPKQAPSFC
jgi:hypothetical protein